MKNKKLLKIIGWMVGVFALLFIALIVIAIALPSTTPVPQTIVSASSQATSTPSNASSSAHIQAVKAISGKSGAARLYPNPDLTPGDILTTDATKVCTPGYSSAVRDVPLSEKKQVYAEYGVSYPQPEGAYEVDHFISLELGGSNDIKNLFLEPAEPRPGFHEKDKVENYLHSQVCSGKMTLQDAQQGIASDWYKYYLLIASGTTATASIKTTTSTSVAPAASVTTTNSPEVKKSSSGICHAKGTQYYDKTTEYTPYNSIDACIASGGRLPK